MQYIIIQHKGNFYHIEKEDFETFAEAYQRGWYIINNLHKYPDTKQLISLSYMNIYKNKGMHF